jgi:hypothetical protein
VGFREDEARGGGQEKMGWDDDDDDEAEIWGVVSKEQGGNIGRHEFRSNSDNESNSDSDELVTHRIVMLLRQMTIPTTPPSRSSYWRIRRARPSRRNGDDGRSGGMGLLRAPRTRAGTRVRAGASSASAWSWGGRVRPDDDWGRFGAGRAGHGEE